MMRRLKLLGAVALLGIPLAACEEATPPPPVGSIVGTVSIEGTGVDGVSVNLSNGNSTTTAGGGSYRFDNVEGGAYTVTISGFPSDATFDATSAAATISSAGQSVTLNFTGAYIRTASVMGSVTVENMGLPGVTVTLTGVSGATATTDDSGQYAFTGLRMGSYSVEISSFDSDEVGFSSTSASVTVGVGESKIVSFDGTYLRTAGIMGRVSVDGEGLPNVTVSLAGGPDNTDMTTMTDAAGQYSFAKLRGGDYAVGISGYDTDDYEFEVTSQNVTVALGETANVPFEGVLLRTSGISGRVSVEGMGLDSIMVTLSMADADDMTTMTDAGGTYAFAGLAAGDYTVSIAVDSDAYVFESMSMDVTVADDQTAIVNFEGTHAMTASVSGMLFIDELMKNDMYDEGEDPLPHAGVPVVLVGPGVNDQMPSATNEMGQFAFTGLKAGDYQLVVPVTEPMGDFAYGGSATGYALEVGVGESVTQNLPIDITHTTVHFGVTLKRGDTRGMPLPGAMVTLYSDAMGDNKVGEGMTMVDEETMHAVASIRVERDGTSGNMVYAGVAAEGYYDDGEMTAVKWDPQKTYTQGANANDILNLNVDVSVSGATIETEADGSGEPLEDWAISIAHGDVMEADTLDEDGMTSFKMELPEAVLPQLPKAFTFSVDTAQASSLDGGEKFEATSYEYMHTGLALAGTVEGSLEVKYTTQTLRVWVHQEVDQVPGYTRTLSGGDRRPWYGGIRSGSSHPDFRTVPDIILELRYIDENGRSRPVPDYENRERHPYTRYGNSSEGWVVYRNVPADLDIVVKARAEGGRKIINTDEAQAYRDFEANKILDGAFGDQGGFHHTVNLCPESADDPDQDYLIEDRCSTFAYVWTRDVSGDALAQTVEMAENPLDGHVIDTTYHSGIQLSLNPVDRKNVQADGHGGTSRAENNNTLARELGTYSISNVGDGQYRRSASSGWTTTRTTLTYSSTESGADANVPPADQAINIFPNSVYVYGTVTDADGVGVEDVEVSSGGVSTLTDDYGRYILADLRHHAWTYFDVVKAGYRVTNRTQHAIDNDYIARRDLRAHIVANRPQEVNFSVGTVTPTGTVSGTITHLQSDAPLEGVRVFALKLDQAAPADLSMPGLLQVDTEDDANGDPMPVFTFDGVEFADVDTTDADGTFSVDAPAGALNGKTTTIIAYRSGMFFMPDRHITTVVEGGEYSISFDGLRLSAIDGRIVDAAGNGMSGVTVTATGGTTGAAGVTRVDTTLASGRYNIRVPWGPYTVTPTKEAYSFEPASLSLTLAAEQVQTLQNFEVSADDNVRPTFTSDSTFMAAENQTVAGTVVATDADTEDDVTGYAITGGADMAMLSIDNAGALTFDDAPDFENPGDADEDNDYEVTVTATSGTGARVRTASQNITVTVTDEDDHVNPVVTLVLTPASISENEGESTITATVSPAATAAFNVTVSAEGSGDNAATADDFNFGSTNNRTLHFRAGATSSSGSDLGQPVKIVAVNDNDYTGNLTVSVTGTVTSGTDEDIDGPEAQTLTIVDDDEANLVSLKLSATSIDEVGDDNAATLAADIERPLNNALTVAFTLVGDGYTGSGGSFTAGTGDTATASVTIAAGATSSTDTVTITATVDDADVENHSVMISAVADTMRARVDGLMQPEDVTLTIVDDDEAPGAISDLGATAADPAANDADVTVTLTWTPPANLGAVSGTDATATTVVYQYRTRTQGQQWTAWPTDGSTNVLTTAAGTGGDVGKLTADVATQAVNNTHQYQVRAIATNTGPPGPDSNTAEVVIPPAPTS